MTCLCRRCDRGTVDADWLTELTCVLALPQPPPPSQAMLRLVELEGGSISVDGIDLGKLALPDVRGRAVCIIPQDPILFSGTIRSNLGGCCSRGGTVWLVIEWLTARESRLIVCSTGEINSSAL